MKRVSKNIQLLTISFLMAPMILSTHAVLALENKEIPEQHRLAQSATVIENGTEPADQLSKVTITIDPELFERIQLKTQDGQVLTGTQDGVLTVESGTKLSYTILSNETQKLIVLAIHGGEEMDAGAQTFVVGTKNIFITILAESTPPTEDSSKPNEDEPVMDSSTNDSEGKEPESSTNSTTDSSGSTIEQDNHTGYSADNLHQSKPGNSIKPEQPNKETADQTNNSGETAFSKNTTTQSQMQVSGSIESRDVLPSENFVTKTPINEAVHTNTNMIQQAIVQEALKHLGKSYIWGAKGPNQFDCSGLAYYVYIRSTGYFIGTWTGEQQYAGTQIPISQAQPGDLFFWGSPTGVTTNVAIYLGENQFIHATQPGEKVKITSISEYPPDFAVRIGLSDRMRDGFLDSPILNNFNEELTFTQNQSTTAFLEKIAEEAREIGQKEGIYASVMLAQAILESGSGNSQLSREPNYNLFGIKGKYKGNSIIFDTFEKDKVGKNYQAKAEFRKYPSYKESLEDYTKLIKEGIAGNEVFYKPVWKSEADNYREATSYLQGHYATDKQYAQKLNNIIETYDLTQYDMASKAEHHQYLSMPLTANILSQEAILKAKNVTYYFTSSKIRSIFDLRYYFSLKKIPEQQRVTTIKANELTSVGRTILKKMFLLHLLSQK
ncbi:MAG: glucosaminidase domain-containing protein [Enterococcus lacertideformus]|uniref:Glucosaminidase domain-containing protein n=1 Tax=Enterococcus lacertideformus TaxID=2771493 RepID=A0A931AZ63_9ENTE|nr:glucosaminidase domain-containing protein [Enterococcus lacertideformus]